MAARPIRRKADPAGASPGHGAKRAPDATNASRINAFLAGKRPLAAELTIPKSPGPAQACKPAMVNVGALRHVLGLRRALRTQQAPIPRAEPLPVGDNAPVSRPCVAALNFALWWLDLRRFALADSDATMLACWVFAHTTADPARPDAAAVIDQFLDELLDVAPRYEAHTADAALRALQAKANKKRGRGRPKGRTISDDNITAAREVAQQLFADSERLALAVPDDPWHVLLDVGAALDKFAATDRGVSNTPALLHADGTHKSALRKAWFGDAQRGLPSLRRWFLAELLGVLCLIAWDDMFEKETGRRPLLGALRCRPRPV